MRFGQSIDSMRTSPPTRAPNGATIKTTQNQFHGGTLCACRWAAFTAAHENLHQQASSERGDVSRLVDSSGLLRLDGEHYAYCRLQPNARRDGTTPVRRQDPQATPPGYWLG